MISVKNSYEIAYNGTENECRFELCADTAADLQGLTHIDGIKIQMGSECTDIATGDKYLLNGYGAWILQPSQNAFSNVYTKTEIDAMIANYYTKTESDAQFEWITVTITTDTLPLSFISDGSPLTAWSISGNGQQNGTPTPSAPVDFVGCGDWDSDESSYAIPLTCAGQTTPLYLGEVSTTRRIKRLVLTGEEEFLQYSGSTGVGLRLTVDDIRIPSSVAQRIDGYCTHFVPTTSPAGAIGDTVTFGTSSNMIYIILSVASQQALNVSTYEEFKVWIARQYANGTPVIIWYILAEPETAIVNEPLMKIGDYADTLTTDTPIPTAKGSNTLTVDTTVQPSEVSITGGIRNE